MAETGRTGAKNFEQLLKNMDALAGVETRVGWFSNSAYPDGRPVAAVAAGNEFGIPSRSIPPRPYFRPTNADKKAEWAEKASKLAKRVLNGLMTAREAFDVFGGIVEGDVAKAITDVQTPPLSKITLGARKYRAEGKPVTGRTIGEIARKLKEGKLDVSGVSTKPLVDTAVMVNTLTHTVENSK